MIGAPINQLEKRTMNFKEALIAHLQGVKVEVKTKGINEPWEALFSRIKNFTLSDVVADNCGAGCEFRLAPRTIMVNGMEVPAPERGFPERGTEMWHIDLCSDSLASWFTYDGTDVYSDMLKNGLLYLNKEDAIARAKAMLLTQSK